MKLAKAEITETSVICKAFDAVNFAVAVSDVKEHIRKVNREFLRLHGISSKECAGKTFYQFIVPEDRIRLRRELQKALRKGSSHVCFRVRGLRKNGEVFPAEIDFSIVKVKGKARLLVEVVRDITRQSFIEEQLKKRTKELMALMKSGTEMLQTQDLRKRLQVIAEAIRGLGWRRVVISVRDENLEPTSPEDIVTAGLTPEEVEFLWKNRPPGKVWRERFGPEFQRFRIGEFYYLPWSDPWVRKKFTKGVVPSRIPPEEMVDWDPQDMLYAPLRVPGGRIVGILSVDDPVDGRRPTRESLAPLELFLHQAAVAIENAQLIKDLQAAKDFVSRIMEQSPLGILVFDKNGICISINKAGLRIFGIQSSSEVAGCFNLFRHKGLIRTGLLKAFKRAYAGETVFCERDFSIPKAHGKKGKRILALRIFPVLDEKGAIQSVVELCEDITERKMLENKVREYAEQLELKVEERTRELLELEKKYETVVENANDGIAIFQDNVFVFVNKRLTEMTGYSRKEYIGKPMFQHVPEPYRTQVKRLIQRISKKKPKHLGPFTVKVLTKDGREIFVEVNSTLIEYENKPAILAVLRDVTERLRMQKELENAQRLATIGELAASIGHDLRNPLTGISGAVYYLKMKLAGKMDAKIREMFEIIENDVKYANRIVNDLLDFSREIKLKPSKMSISKIVNEVLSETKIPTNVKVINAAEEAHVAILDECKMKRVFHNIVRNAIQAMPKGGTLKITSKKSRGLIKISFQDTGVGIPKKHLDKIFTPLFTTKAKGVGLGLSICKRIVEAHGGRITVQSKVGEGTCFTVILPVEPKKVEGGEESWMKSREYSLSMMMPAYVES